MWTYAPGPGHADLPCESILFMGVHYEIMLAGQDGMRYMVHSTDPVAVGDTVDISLEPDAIHVMKTSDEPLAGEQEEPPAEEVEA